MSKTSVTNNLLNCSTIVIMQGMRYSLEETPSWRYSSWGKTLHLLKRIIKCKVVAPVEQSIKTRPSNNVFRSFYLSDSKQPAVLCAHIFSAKSQFDLQAKDITRYSILCTAFVFNDARRRESIWKSCLGLSYFSKRFGSPENIVSVLTELIKR